MSLPFSTLVASLTGSGNPASITGTLTSGSTLTANLAPSAGTASSWQWTLNGANISGQTAQTYTVLSTDPGQVIGVKINGTYSASVSIPAIPPVFSAAPIITAAGTTSVTYTAATLSNAGAPAATLFHDLYANGSLLAAGYTSGAAYGTQTVGVVMTLVPRAVQGGTTVVGTTSAGVAVTAAPAATLRAASATNRFPDKLATVSVGTATTPNIFYRIPFVIGDDISAIILGEANSALVGASGITNPGNALSIVACNIEIGAASVAVTWGGSGSVTLANGSNTLSDSVPASSFSLAKFARGTVGRIRVQYQMATTGLKLPHSDGQPGTASIDAVVFDPLKVNITNGVSGTGSFAYSMINGGVNGTDAVFYTLYHCPIILGVHGNGTAGHWGDSKTEGFKDAGTTLGARGMNRLNFGNVATASTARSAISFGSIGGNAIDTATPIGGATVAQLTYWYQFCTSVATVGYGTNSIGAAASNWTNLYAQIRANSTILPIIQRSLTPNTQQTTAPTGLSGDATTVTAVVPAAFITNLGLTIGQTFVGYVTGTTPSGYGTSLAGVTMTIASTTSITYANVTVATATGFGTISDCWETLGNQTIVSGYGIGSTANTLQTNLKALVAGDANLSYFETLTLRGGTDSSQTPYWNWAVNGTAFLETAEGLHESSKGYEDFCAGTGNYTTNTGGTTTATLRTVFQALLTP